MPTLTGSTTGPLTTTTCDAANNCSSTQDTIPTLDTAIPVITLSGNATMTLPMGGSYTEQGALWTDNVDGNGILPIPDSGSVDMMHV